MSGFYGSISKTDCVSHVFYGTDYHSHLGTKRAGMAFFNSESGFQRAIHSLEDGYFRSKFENDIKNFLIDYGRTIRSIPDGNELILKIRLTRCEECKIPKSIEVSVKMSVLKQYDQQKITKEKALASIVIKKDFDSKNF